MKTILLIEDEPTLQKTLSLALTQEGYEVKSETVKNIPVIVLTNLESTQDIEKALALGATNYLVKANYDLKDVIEKVKDNIK